MVFAVVLKVSKKPWLLLSIYFSNVVSSPSLPLSVNEKDGDSRRFDIYVFAMLLYRLGAVIAVDFD